MRGPARPPSCRPPLVTETRLSHTSLPTSAEEFISVVHVSKLSTSARFDIDCRRPSKLGNPFAISVCRSPHLRSRATSAYAQWIQLLLHGGCADSRLGCNIARAHGASTLSYKNLGDADTVLAALSSLSDAFTECRRLGRILRLGCSCGGDPCHAGVLRRFLLAGIIPATPARTSQSSRKDAWHSRGLELHERSLQVRAISLRALSAREIRGRFRELLQEYEHIRIEARSMDAWSNWCAYSGIFIPFLGPAGAAQLDRPHLGRQERSSFCKRGTEAICLSGMTKEDHIKASLCKPCPLDEQSLIDDCDLDWAIGHVVGLGQHIRGWRNQQHSRWRQLLAQMEPINDAAYALMPPHVRRCPVSRHIAAWVLLVWT